MHKRQSRPDTPTDRPSLCAGAAGPPEQGVDDRERTCLALRPGPSGAAPTCLSGHAPAPLGLSCPPGGAGAQTRPRPTAGSHHFSHTGGVAPASPTPHLRCCLLCAAVLTAPVQVPGGTHEPGVACLGSGGRRGRRCYPGGPPPHGATHFYRDEAPDSALLLPEVWRPHAAVERGSLSTRASPRKTVSTEGGLQRRRAPEGGHPDRGRAQPQTAVQPALGGALCPGTTACLPHTWLRFRAGGLSRCRDRRLTPRSLGNRDIGLMGPHPAAPARQA